MVYGRPLDHLKLEPGAKVTAYGTLEPTEQGRVTLWTVAAWDAMRPGRLEGANVDVQFVDDADLPSGQVVQVVGTWYQGRIVDAAASTALNPSAYHYVAAQGHLSPAELGQKRFVELLEWLRARAAAPVIATGGTASTMWIHVLYVTPELVQAHRELPLRTDVFASVTPQTL